MARLYKRGKVWYSDLFINGHRVQKALSGDKRIAEEKLGELVKQRGAAKHGHLVTSETYSVAKERFLQVYIHKSPITYGHYKRAFKNLEAFRLIKELSQITPDLLTALMIDWKARKRGLYVRNRDMRNILTFMRRAERWAMVSAQDWDLVEGRDREPRGRVEFFTPKEVRQLLSKTWGMWRTMVMLGARAGLRPGEMYWLEWSDVDLKAGKLHIDSKLHHGWNVKTYERRTIPMPKDLIGYLRKLTRDASSFVLIGEAKDRPAGIGSMSTYFRRRVKAAGLHGHPYKLRHTYGSHLAQAGVSLQIIRDLLGHRSITTTEIYAHLHPEMHRSAIEKLPDV